ncbi:hypothetical protein ABS771_22865 [Methylobacterium brachiatum]|uniref:hypothetical protein n=1 Tax=Methylobacterium brachiatum TaxID=269660 RepID=UPI00331558B2
MIRTRAVRPLALAGAAALLLGTAAIAQTPPPGRGPPPPPPKGAHFRLERGDTRIDVKCADEDSMKACADITLQLVDKLGTLRPADAR